MTLALFQFSFHYHIISYPSSNKPNTQATEVIQLQIGAELSEGLTRGVDVFLEPQSSDCFLNRYKCFGTEDAFKEIFETQEEGNN